MRLDVFIAFLVRLFIQPFSPAKVGVLALCFLALVSPTWSNPSQVVKRNRPKPASVADSLANLKTASSKDSLTKAGKAPEDAEDSDEFETIDMDKSDSLNLSGKQKAGTPPATPMHFAWSPTEKSDFKCREMAETSVECLRGQLQITGVSSGLPGSPTHAQSLSLWEPIVWHSPYQPGHVPNGYSHYRQGGFRLPDSLSQQGPAFAPFEIGESWRPTAPLDTPLTRLRWQRGALVFNQFQVDLDRALVGGSYVGFSYASQTSDSQSYGYSFNVSQPYLSGWGALGKIYGPIDRDSASLVLDGYQPGILANHMRPRLGFWLDSNRVIELFYDRVRNRSQLAMPRNVFTHDSVHAPMGSAFESDGLGILYGGAWDAWTYSAGYVHTGSSRQLNPKSSLDTLASATSTGSGGLSREWTTDRFEWQARMQGQHLAVAPWLRLESEQWQGPLRLPGGVNLNDGEGWRDRESFGVTLSTPVEQPTDSFSNSNWNWNSIVGGAIHRESRLTDRQVYLPEGFIQTQVFAPWGMRLDLSGDIRRTDPEPEILVDDAWALNRLASPGLNPRWDEGLQALLHHDGERFGAYAGFEAHWLQNAWGPKVLPSPFACEDVEDSLYTGLTTVVCNQQATVSDTLALRLRNFDSRQRLQWIASLRFGLGNWRLWLENRFLALDRISDSKLAHDLDVTTVPQRVFRGQLLWTRRLIENRMRVVTQWDWEWVSTRQTWAANGNGTATALKLDEYLTLDFYAAMQIKTFTLHFRAQNMNHDRYAPEVGVHPLGVNFRFGVDWSLFN